MIIKNPFNTPNKKPNKLFIHLFALERRAIWNNLVIILLKTNINANTLLKTNKITNQGSISILFNIRLEIFTVMVLISRIFWK